ncbi:hypothetical protein [Thomasclavelia cocleata]|uniref:hypothetical protein n=1 Tax=Thomasclavelia cocleata TaxID=69824 RepID=UPI00272D56FD|nr:hypothetical protein [Thomasclavelia cocleata]
MSTNTNFNHNMFSKHLNDAYFEIMNMKREDTSLRFTVGTNKCDEEVRVNVFDNEKIIKIITFKGGKKYYKSIEGGNRNGNQA